VRWPCDIQWLFVQLLLLAGYVAAIFKLTRHSALIDKATRAAARQLGTGCQDTNGKAIGSIIVGSRDGLRFTYQNKPGAARWSQIEVSLPQGYPLMLSLMDHPRDRWGVLLSDDGESHDIEIGDREFDARFLITGAPEPVISRLFTYDIRKKLLRYAANDVMIQTTEQGVCRCLFRSCATETAEVAKRCELGIAIVSQLREVQRMLDGDVPIDQTPGESPFRAVPSDEALEKIREKRRAAVTVALVHQRQRDRQLARKRRTKVALVVLAIALSPIVFRYWLK
jgi:hypothetical protein